MSLLPMSGDWYRRMGYNMGDGPQDNLLDTMMQRLPSGAGPASSPWYEKVQGGGYGGGIKGLPGGATLPFATGGPSMPPIAGGQGAPVQEGGLMGEMIRRQPRSQPQTPWQSAPLEGPSDKGSKY